MKTLKSYKKKMAKIKENILAIQDMHPGSLSKQYNICGKAGCRCKDPEKPEKHGPYYQLSYVHKGKSTSRFIKPEFVPEINQQIANYKKFKVLVENWKDLATEVAKMKTDAGKKRDLMSEKSFSDKKHDKKQKSPSQQDSKNSMSVLLKYCKDINEWPGRWTIEKADLKIGQAIVEQFKLFLIDRIEKDRAKSTIKIYAHYLCALGGELIRQINYDKSERQLSTKNLILKYISDSGGPYWDHARDGIEHSRYNSVCKQLFKFMTKNPN